MQLAAMTVTLFTLTAAAAAQDKASDLAFSHVKRIGWSSMRGAWGKRALDDEISEQDLQGDEKKRGTWNNFKGSWGKRTPELSDYVALQTSEKKRAGWNKFQGSWGKRGEETINYLQNGNEKRKGWNKFQGSWGKKAGWNNLQGAWGKREWKNLQGAWGKRADGTENGEDDVIQDEVHVSPEPLEETTGGSQVKRGWGPWGKRPDYPAISPRSTNWSSLRGTWGKRGRDWSSLRGAWGKRNPNDWAHFRGTWGKRFPGILLSD